MFSMPILFALGGFLLFLVRAGGMKLSHAIMGVLLGAQLSATFVASGLGAAFTAAGHLLGSVFT
jgi:hypothetical protein